MTAPDPVEALSAAAEDGTVCAYIERDGVGMAWGVGLDQAVATVRDAEEVLWLDPPFPETEYTLLARKGSVTAVFDVRPRPLSGAS